MMSRIVVIGGGFAGLWAAVGAKRALKQERASGGIEVILISKDGYLTIRPRLYEANPDQLRVPLRTVLDPIGVRQVEGTVTEVDPHRKTVTVETANGAISVSYGRLVLAAGSQLRRPDLPGVREHAFSVDTHQDAVTLERHLQALPARPGAPGQYTVVVVGSGLAGVETAAEMVGRLRPIAVRQGPERAMRVMLLERNDTVAPGLGAQARAVVVEALGALGVQMRTGVTVTGVSPAGLSLQGGEWVPAATVIWTGGLCANPLTSLFPVERDELGRLPVNQSLRVEGLHDVFAAGDVARAKTDAEHLAVMSCQHAIVQGKVAGHNAAWDLLGRPLQPYAQHRYSTCIDLGEWGGLFTNGWDQVVKHQGKNGKYMKQLITQHMIYPPLSGSHTAILKAADLKALYRMDQNEKGLGRWIEETIPPVIGLYSFQLLTAWSGVSRTLRTWFRKRSFVGQR